MTDQHPITPPPELVKQWDDEAEAMFRPEYQQHIATEAARWGSDQELEACCEWLKTKEWIHPEFSDELRNLRRPEPPGLKAQALQVLKHAPGPDYPNPITLLTADEHALIRRALEQLDD